MKIFQTLQKLLAFTIIRAKPMNGRLTAEENVQNSSNNYPLGPKKLLPWLVLLAWFILSACYMFSEAKTMTQFSDCFYVLMTSMACICGAMILVWKRAKIFELFDNFENEIEKRKFFLIYS